MKRDILELARHRMHRAKETFSHSFEKRQDSDYEDFVTPTIGEVESIRDRVKLFNEECERILKEF